VVQNYLSIDEKDLRRILPTFFGLIIGVILVVLIGIVTRTINNFHNRNTASTTRSFSKYTYWLVTIMLCLAFLFSPTKVLSGGYTGYDCRWDTIRSYEAAGKFMANIIPKGSTVYWAGGGSTVPLLYVPGIKIFPAQINGGFNFYYGGNSDSLEKFGYWNDELARQWEMEADYILIKKANLKKSSLKDYVMSEEFDELETTSQVSPCVPGSEIHIFRRVMK
jgi:hypothetical protein